MPQPPTPAPAAAAHVVPSPSLLANLRQDLSPHPPFAQMAPADIDLFLTRATQRYYAPGEVLVGPGDGVVQELFVIRSGAVTGLRGLPDTPGDAFQYEAGDMLPISAALAGRAVTTTYTATADTFVLVLPRAAMKQLAGACPVFADFLNRRILGFLELSRRALQASYASQGLAEQSLETPLGQLARQAPVSCLAQTPLAEALGEMQRRRIGSMLVVDPAGRPEGILTRYDVLDRVALGQVPLQTPIGQVMVAPVHTLSVDHTAQDAALLMSRHGIRHVPVTREGIAVGLVSERDLFAIQRLSLKQVSTSIRAAADLATLQQVARDIRDFARNLLGQGVQARQLTTLISHLNDLLTQRLLALKAQQHGVALERMCWLALGSEGRSEQTIATDQDNALILPDDFSDAQRQAALVFAQDVNEALDACGYPLCSGGIMAGQPGCCMTLAQWRARFGHWIEQGAPRDLLAVSIYFDLRPLAGQAWMAEELRRDVLAAAGRTPRFLKQMALNALEHGVALNWRGGIDADKNGSVDLKLQGTAVFVDAARLYSLAHGVAATSTRERFEGVGPRMGVAPAEYRAWIGGFEFLQMLRLRVQLEAGALPQAPNRLRLDSLNDIDRRILKEAFRVARLLQQRLRLDYQR